MPCSHQSMVVCTKSTIKDSYISNKNININKTGPTLLEEEGTAMALSH